MKILKYAAFILALGLSSSAFAMSNGGNGAGPAGGGDSNAQKVGGESGASSGTTGGAPTYEGRAAAEVPVGGTGTSGQQRMGDGANGSNAYNGVNGNTTGYGNSQTTNPMNQ
jgi:hypothetical protein